MCRPHKTKQTQAAAYSGVKMDGGRIFVPTAHKKTTRRRHIPEPKINTYLIFAKSRVAPLKNVSIPRLELIAAMIGTKAIKFTENQVKLKMCIMVDN